LEGADKIDGKTGFEQRGQNKTEEIVGGREMLRAGPYMPGARDLRTVYMYGPCLKQDRRKHPQTTPIHLLLPENHLQAVTVAQQDKRKRRQDVDDFEEVFKVKCEPL
jgi:hypothetical protein